MLVLLVESFRLGGRRTLRGFRAVPHHAEDEINGLVAENCKFVILSDDVEFLLVEYWPTTSVQSFDAKELVVKAATDDALYMRKALELIHLQT